ncbi:NTP transferase domain-containing protein [Erythrobacter sp. 3-20A1M]|uniref:mannose-1-phosphate guanylyltransferase n=1 Tax=Erythrobacter sp. 3-20A1M TaxID=2653850 RepID=UPI001BFC231A|nr:mannose-1-phosphate guanylyltransferase [Erythrobacter sp. 3-20A1M]QWC56518.1 NTP transferase domain-containing protein [Erythrobacter sp. 3-20A1M]
MTEQPRIHPVILCGGGGTRLWPRSRADRPKPFLPLTGERTLFQQALGRCSGEGFAAPIVVAGTAHVPLVREQAGDVHIIAEPAGRNTAPAIALAALSLPADAVMLVCPSDHHIADEDAFRRAAFAAAALAADGWLVSFGITPDRPETGYGYLRHGEPLGPSAMAIARFVEKPDAATARQFLEDGGYSWNGGIFALRAGTYLDELARHRPALADQARAAFDRGREADGVFRPDAAAFTAIEGESIDYAVMENADRVAMVPVAMGWSDIGSWQALRDVRVADGGACQAKHQRIDCSGVMIESDGPRVSVVGLDDVIVVVDGDEVLVTRASASQSVGKLAGAAGK